MIHTLRHCLIASFAASAALGFAAASGASDVSYLELEDVRFEKSSLLSSRASRAQQKIDVETHNLHLGAMTDERPTPFGVGAGFEYQFRSDIDRGGRFSAMRFNAGVSARFRITDEFGLSLGFRYDLDDFRFSGTTMLAPAPGVAEPWDDIHTFTFTSIFRLHLDADWSLFGGPVFQVSRESGASVRDSWIAGGAFGAQYVVSPELTIGGGIGVVTQIEDDMRLFPIILVHWQIIDNLWLTTRTIAEMTGDTGVELVYSWGGGIETAIGLAFRYRRFRLDDGGGVAPDGVGQHTYVPAWLRLGYRVTPNLTVSAHAGFALAGQLRLETRSGSRLGERDYDPAGLLGVNVSFRF